VTNICQIYSLHGQVNKQNIIYEKGIKRMDLLTNVLMGTRDRGNGVGNS
jgi:hypothetical protein